MARPTDIDRESEREQDAGRNAADAGDEMEQDEDLLTDAEEHADGAGLGARDVGLFGAGLGIGLLLGAGIALLLAPRSGRETRQLIGSGARRVGSRVAERFDDMRDDVRSAARRGGRTVRRGMTRGRWKLEDAAERWR